MYSWGSVGDGFGGGPAFALVAPSHPLSSGALGDFGGSPSGAESVPASVPSTGSTAGPAVYKTATPRVSDGTATEEPLMESRPMEVQSGTVESLPTALEGSSAWTDDAVGAVVVALMLIVLLMAASTVAAWRH